MWQTMEAHLQDDRDLLLPSLGGLPLAVRVGFEQVLSPVGLARDNEANKLWQEKETPNPAWPTPHPLPH